MLKRQIWISNDGSNKWETLRKRNSQKKIKFDKVGSRKSGNRTVVWGNSIFNSDADDSADRPEDPLVVLFFVWDESETQS